MTDETDTQDCTCGETLAYPRTWTESPIVCPKCAKQWRVESDSNTTEDGDESWSFWLVAAVPRDAINQIEFSLEDARVILGMYQVCYSEGIVLDASLLLERIAARYPELVSEFPAVKWP